MYSTMITIAGQNTITISANAPIHIKIELNQAPPGAVSDTAAVVQSGKASTSSYAPEEKTTPTVIQFCKQVSEKFKKNGQINSANDYKYLANTIAKIAPNDLSFSEFTKEWLEEVDAFCTERGIKGIGHFRHLKALYNKAIESKIVDFRQNPFKNMQTNPYGFDTAKLRKKKIPQATNLRAKELSKSQLTQVLAYTPKSKVEEKYLDMWLFSYYTFGVNLTDIAHLKHSDIQDGHWFYKRSKTGTGLSKGKPLLPEALAIIKKYDTKGKYIFDILKDPHDQDANSRAKRIHIYAKYISKATTNISKTLNFPRHFTYYSARYTSATIALNAGADRNTVSHLLDHSHFSTIDHYVGRADAGAVLGALERLRV